MRHCINASNSVSADCSALQSRVPATRGIRKTLAAFRYKRLHGSPFCLTQEQVLWECHIQRHSDLPEELATETAHNQFIAKGQPRWRCSPLTKACGWGFHSDTEGKVALTEVDESHHDA